MDYHDQRIVLPPASYAVSPSVTLQRDHHSGLYLIVDVTDVGAAGTLAPQLRLKSKAPAGHNKVIWQASAVIGAVGTYVYLFAPQGIETLGAVDGLQERVALPLPLAVDAVFALGGNAVTFSAEQASLAL